MILKYIVQCPTCQRWFDDETRKAACPHEEI